jgi:phage-related baseplate assembly protein
LRARVNDAARANLLAFAAAGDLDHLAAFYGVARLVGEADAGLRARVVLAILGRSTAGPEEWYAYHALSADVRIKEVRVHRIDGGPEIGVSVLSNEDGGVPDQAMLDAVEAAVTAPSVRVISDVVTVAAATQSTENIAAQIWLLPGTPYSVFEGLEDVLRAAWDAESGIGFDLNPSWVAAKLHVPGVAKVSVTSPSAPVVVADVLAVAIGDMTLTYAGVSR